MPYAPGVSSFGTQAVSSRTMRVGLSRGCLGERPANMRPENKIKRETRRKSIGRSKENN